MEYNYKFKTAFNNRIDYYFIFKYERKKKIFKKFNCSKSLMVHKNY